MCTTLLVALVFGCESRDGVLDTAGESTEAASTTAGASAPTVDATSPADTDLPTIDTGGSTGPSTTEETPAGPSVTFRAHFLDPESDGPAFTTVVDIDDDGSLDVIVSAFGTSLSVPPGTVTLYRRGATLDDWTPEVIAGRSEGIRFPNQTHAADLDGDGDLDVIVPYGFLVCEAVPWVGRCGGLAWFEQTPGGWIRHTLVDGEELFFHGVQLADLDGDGLTDMFTVRERINAFGPDTAEAVWFRGSLGPDLFDPRPQVAGPGLGSFPTLHDVDGDGDLDAVSAEYAMEGGSFAWLEQVTPPGLEDAGEWERHILDDTSGPSIQLALIPDLYGDGVLRAVGSNHTNTEQSSPDPWESAILAFTPTADPRDPWAKEQLSEGIRSAPGSIAAPQAAPGIFGWGDLDGDGDLDLAVAGDGDPRVMWMEQQSPGRFAMRILNPDLPQAGGMSIVDLDGNGTNEIIVTGYEDSVVFVLERE